MKKFTILGFILCFCFIACKKSEEAKTSNTNASSSTQSTVAAVVNGKQIMISELDKQVDRFEGKFREINPKMKLPEDKRAKMRKDFLERVIRDKILEQAASDDKLTVSDQEIDEKISQLQKIFGEGDEAKQKFLGGITDMNEFRQNIAQQIKIDKFFEKQLRSSPVAITDDEIKEYFDKNPDQYKEEEAIKVRHILWKLPAKDAADYEEKHTTFLKEAMQVIKDAQAGSDFAELAKKYSQDTNAAQNGGDLGWVTHNKMVKEFEEAAFKMKAGEISSPVETKFGIHVIQALEKRPERIKNLDEVKEDIRGSLDRKRNAEMRETVYKQLRDKAKVETLI